MEELDNKHDGHRVKFNSGDPYCFTCKAFVYELPAYYKLPAIKNDDGEIEIYSPFNTCNS